MRLLVFLCLAALLGASGCTNPAKDEASPSPQNQNLQIKVQQTAPDTNNELPTNNGDVAERLEKLAKSVPEVKNATSVVFGNIAIVGIDVDGNLDRGRVGSVKYSVAEALREDPAGVNAVVTADIDIRNRLLEIRKDIENGTPVSGFAQELSNIIGRIIPQLPRHTAPKAEPQGHPDDRKNVR